MIAGEVDEGCGCGAMLLHPLAKLTSLLSVGHAVHPVEPFMLENSQFIRINRRTRVRILHAKPDNISIPLRNVQYEAAEKRHSINRNSLSEEYWFTRWNKPLKSNPCNCSFRRSQRFSRLSEQFPVANLRKSHQGKQDVIRMSELRSSYDVPATKIVNVETFVERLIQETLFESYQEFYMSNCKKVDANGGVDNYGFLKSADDVDGVVLRRNKKTPAVLPTECKPASISHNNVKDGGRTKCAHAKKKTELKPLVILLHGIGSSADVWWNVMKSLLGRGFEVVAPDMLGHGYSSAPNKRKAYRFKKLLNHTLSVFDHFAAKDENRKFIIIGHSFGCSLATALSRYRPQQIVQLVLISGGGPTALSAPVTGNEISVFSCLQLLISPLLFCGMKRSIFYSSRGKHFKPCDLDSSIPKYVLDYLNLEQNWPEGDAAFHRRILIPTLLVHGLKDTQVTLVQECEMERTIPRAFLELIPTAGHMSILETPEQLSHMILCFVDWWAR